jgi:predicted oxidoreductase
MQTHFDTIIVGGGIAGLVAALELLQRQPRQILIIDRDTPERIGGLARWAFGGMALSGTREQQRQNIPDSPEILLQDWHGCADFGDQDVWPRAWAKCYAEENNALVYQWLRSLGAKFLPAVNWVERGLFKPGNSVPRYHVLWGTGWHLVTLITGYLEPFLASRRLTVAYQHRVDDLIISDDAVVGVTAIDEQTGARLEFLAGQTIVACGGINGSIEKVRQHWHKPWGEPPETMLNGANRLSDGKLHEQIEDLGGNITHKSFMWNYAAGIPHPQADFEGHGLSLIPCKSALWLNHLGLRIGPMPLVTGFDTNYLCQQVVKQEMPWTWQVLNWKIAARELAVSGSAHNPSIRDKKPLRFLKEILMGNHRLVRQLAEESDDFLVADDLPELTEKMNNLTERPWVEYDSLSRTVRDYDRQFSGPASLCNDDQVRRIMHCRQWRPDRLRTCKPAAITDKNAGPLIAIRLQLISRKSLGGVQTDLQGKVLRSDGASIAGLYCVGEAAGFGGGGANGFRSLEGTFLPGCILTARKAAMAIALEPN